MNHPDDGPTIGLLLCKSKNKVVAEYALRDQSQPLGVAEYQLVESLPPEFQTQPAEYRADRTGTGWRQPRVFRQFTMSQPNPIPSVSVSYAQDGRQRPHREEGSEEAASGSVIDLLVPLLE